MVEIVLITGCATGIGRALAENFNERTTKDGKRAFKVYATDYRLSCVEDLEEKGMNVAALDVTSIDSINDAVSSILAKEGRIDLLICNAGVTAPGFLTEMAYEDIVRVFNVNLHGVFRVVQPVAKAMMGQRSGKIAIMSSVNAYVVQPYNAPYSGTKSAGATMAESLRMELEPFGITVTSVCPGWVRSDIVNNAPFKATYDRYEREGSFYEECISVIRWWQEQNKGVSGGCTTTQAAEDISRQLAKARPPRYVKTGTLLYYALFWGCLQQWVRGIVGPKFRQDVLRDINLFKAADNGPRKWEGHYVPVVPEEEGMLPPESLLSMRSGLSLASRMSSLSGMLSSRISLRPSTLMSYLSSQESQSPR